MTEVTVQGNVASGFERVKDAFAANFERGEEVGAAFSLYHRGEKVIDIWGGVADEETGRPWAQDSLVLVFSTTKGATAICAHVLAQRGELDIDAPVAEYWPEFAAAGKQDIPVRWLLSHRAGLPAHDEVLTAEQTYAWEPAIRALEATAPAWEPGTAHGYHTGTFGFLVGEVVKRISGKSLGTFFADEVAGPLGLDFWIGLPESEEKRVSPMVSLQADDSGDWEIDLDSLPPDMRKLAEIQTDPNSLLRRSMEFAGVQPEPNSREFHAAELPAGNGITDARSLARMYAGLIGDGVDGVRLFTDETVARVSAEQSSGPDQVLINPSRFGLGFNLNYSDINNLGQEGAFGHAGAGGSIGFADPKAGIGFGYVMNKMQMYQGDDPRTLSLVAAVHESLKSL